MQQIRLFTLLGVFVFAATAAQSGNANAQQSRTAQDDRGAPTKDQSRPADQSAAPSSAQPPSSDQTSTKQSSEPARDGQYAPGRSNSTAGQSNSSPSDQPTRPTTAQDSQKSTAPGVAAIIPRGTELVVRTTENIESRTALEGQKFNATLDRDVTNSTGAVVIPKGSQVQLVIRRVPAGTGEIAGSTDLVLDLYSVSVNGTSYFVGSATLLGQQGVAGTIGETPGVVTAGKEIRVPAQTVLSFRLDNDLQLQQAQ